MSQLKVIFFVYESVMEEDLTISSSNKGIMAIVSSWLSSRVFWGVSLKLLRIRKRSKLGGKIGRTKREIQGTHHTCPFAQTFSQRQQRIRCTL